MSPATDQAVYSRYPARPRIEIRGPAVERSERVLTPLALQLLASLHRRFKGCRTMRPDDDAPAAWARRMRQLESKELVRPRGWDIAESHVHIDGVPVAGALFDVAVACANSLDDFVRRGAGPRFDLPPPHGPLEAKLWRDVLRAIEAALGLRSGAIKAIAEIDT